MNKTLKYILIIILILSLTLLYIFKQTEINLFVSDLTNTPQNVTISNITDNSFTVSWYTKEKDQGYLLYDTDEISNWLYKEQDTLYASDERVKFGNLDTPIEDKTYYTHHITIEGLDSETIYNFKVSNGTRIWDISEISNSSNTLYATQFYTKTLEQPTTLKNPTPLYGRNTLNNKTSTDSILYVINDKTEEVLSTTTNDTGYWLVDLTNSTIENQRINVIVQTNNNLNRYQTSINYPAYTNKRVDLNIETETTTKLISQVYAKSINCDQSVADQSIPGTKDADAYAKLASNWTNGAGKTYAKECYNDTVCTAKKAGIDPTFALLVWLHESAASNYTFASSPIEDFGIHIPSVPQEDYKAQITKFTQLSHTNPCSALSFWDGWATNYLNGSCDPTEKNFLTGETGPEYAASMKEIWSWVSSNSFPSKIKIAPSSAGCGGGGTTTGCVEQCPGSDGVLRSCTPPESDGTSEDSLCNSAGRVQSCGNQPYCCPSADGDWTTDMSKCPNYEDLDNPDDPGDVKNFKIDFQKNLSLISFPFTPLNGDMESLHASDFMNEFSNKSNNYFEWIAQFKNNKWSIYTIDDDGSTGVGTDFEIIPGEGYMVMTEDTVSEEFTITMSGLELEENPIHSFRDGWNLIGLGSNETHKASTYLEDITDGHSNSYWDNPTATYKGIILEDDKLYGEDFNMTELLGYFIFIKDTNTNTPPPPPSSENCVEQCPGSDGILRSCTPPEADGTAGESLCNTAGRTEVCGNVDYCCPSTNGTWTTDMSKCN